jgi:hypothetical protein
MQARYQFYLEKKYLGCWKIHKSSWKTTIFKKDNLARWLASADSLPHSWRWLASSGSICFVSGAGAGAVAHLHHSETIQVRNRSQFKSEIAHIDIISANTKT